MSNTGITSFKVDTTIDTSGIDMSKLGASIPRINREGTYSVKIKDFSLSDSKDGKKRTDHAGNPWGGVNITLATEEGYEIRDFIMVPLGYPMYVNAQGKESGGLASNAARFISALKGSAVRGDQLSDEIANLHTTLTNAQESNKFLNVVVGFGNGTFVKYVKAAEEGADASYTLTTRSYNKSTKKVEEHAYLDDMGNEVSFSSADEASEFFKSQNNGKQPQRSVSVQTYLNRG